MISSSFKSLRLYVYGTVSFILSTTNISLLQLGAYTLANIFLYLVILTLSPTLNLLFFFHYAYQYKLFYYYVLKNSNFVVSPTSIGFILIVLRLVLLHLLTMFIQFIS